jgi:hypothetical protein
MVAHNFRLVLTCPRLPSEGKYSRRAHVVDLRHVKEPYEHEKMLLGKIQRPCFSPVFHLLRYLLSMVVPPLDVSGGRIRMTRTG